jgi:hypothetical protein
MSDPHLTQEQLVLLLDSESETARRHLAGCALCRDRLDELENVFAGFVAIHHESLNSQLPPAAEPRALLRSRIERAAATNRFNWWYPAYALAACLALFAIFHRPLDLSKPKTTLTPGEIRTVSLTDVCRDNDDDSVRAVPVSMRQQVFREYGIDDARPGAYEVDYLITPELGGANSIRNLWPEPYSAVWNAHVKDELEQRLHGLVCSGQVDLATAQRDISRDWIGAYKKYFHTDRPW